MARRYILDPIVHMPENGFVLAIKKDTDYVVQSLSVDASQRENVTKAYDHFCEELNKAFETFFPDPFELHIFDDIYVENQQKSKAASYIAVSLDPCVKEPDALSFGVSRHFQPGGLNLIGLDARPGFPPLAQQIETLRHHANGNPVALIEDDIFSGFTMRQTVERLHENNIPVKVIIPGIQIGTVSTLTDDVTIDPVHRYQGTPEQMKHIDLTDYRDFLLGADGLVIDAGEKGKSRVPFLMPFTSPHIRITLPVENEKAFSDAVWKLNAEFFDKTQLCAGQMNPFAIAGLKDIMPIDAKTPMRDIVQRIKDI